MKISKKEIENLLHKIAQAGYQNKRICDICDYCKGLQMLGIDCGKCLPSECIVTQELCKLAKEKYGGEDFTDAE